MKPRVPLPSQFEGRAFSVADAAAAGLGRGRVNGPDLDRPFRGLRSSGLDVRTHLGRYRVVTVMMGESWAFSHASAALIWGFPLPWRVVRDPLVHIAVPPGVMPSRRAGISGHRTDTAGAVVRGGLRVLPPLTVWSQLGELLTLGELVAAGDFLLSGTRPHATAERIAAHVDACAGRRRVELLREAHRLVREGVDSPKETELRLLLTLGMGLPEPVVNKRYFGEHGDYLGKADLSWPLWRIVLEYEGDQHRLDRAIFRQDLARRERFESAGWSVIRVTDDDLGTARAAFEHTVRARIRRQCRLMGIEGSV